MPKNFINIGKFEDLCGVALKESVMPYAQKYQHLFAQEYDKAHPTSKSVGMTVETYVQILRDRINQTSRVIHIPIGLVSSAPDYIRSRAHVLEDGTGQIWSKPGMDVYDSEWREKHKSTAEEEVRYPELEHDGQHVVENVHRIAQSKAKDWSKQATADVIRYLADHIRECIDR